MPKLKKLFKYTVVQFTKELENAKNEKKKMLV